MACAAGAQVDLDGSVSGLTVTVKARRPRGFLRQAAIGLLSCARCLAARKRGDSRTANEPGHENAKIQRNAKYTDRLSA